jgi:site-specific recombinase XerD
MDSGGNEKLIGGKTMSKFVNKNCPERKDCWLSNPIDSYLTHLKIKGHSNKGLQDYAEVLLGFASFLEPQGVGETDDLNKWIEPFGEHESNPSSKESACRIITDFVGHLQKTGVIPKAKAKASPFARTLSGYETFLREIRGLKPTSIKERISYCAKFLKYLRDSGVIRIRGIKHDDIQSFVVSEGKQYARKTMVDKCSVLRKFLSYLYSKGSVRTDLSAVIAIPRLYKHERCPSVVGWAMPI